MKPTFPAGPSTRSALYLLGLLAALKGLSLVLMAQSVAGLLAGLAATSGGGTGPHAGGLQFTGALLAGAAGAVLRSLVTWAQGTASRRAALGVKEELRSRLLERSLTPQGLRTGGRTQGGLALLATRGLDALDAYYTQFLPSVVNCAVVPLLLGARILFADWVSAVVVVLTVPLVPLFMVLIGRHTEDRVREAQTALSTLSGHIVELAKGLPVLVGLGRAVGQRKALEDLSEEYRRRTMGTLRTAFLSALALELIATISVAVVAVFIGVRLVAGEMPLEAGLLALILAPDCYLALRELGTAHHASDDGRVALAAVSELLDDVPPARLQPSATGREGLALAPAHEDSADWQTAARQTSARQSIRQMSEEAGSMGLCVSGLTVRYAGRAGTAVGPLTFSVRPGRVTALAGPSGSGKSTVLGVLAGTVRDDGDGTSVTGDGTSVTGEWSGFRTGDVAWVPQHPAMVAGTVRDEIRLYLQGSGAVRPGQDAAVEECLLRAAASHLADRNPAELSPGELRRVALARGLARIEAGATLLLLDEPTAHLDSDAARAVHDAITGLPDAVTVVLVAHDAQTRALADDVVDVFGGDGHRTPVSANEAPAAPKTLAGRSGAGAPAIPAGTSGSGVVDASVNVTVAARSIQSGDATGRRAGSTPEGTVSGPKSLALLARLLAPVSPKFALAAGVAVLAAAFAVALSGLSGWLIIRASEQPPILYLLGAIVGVRFFGIGRAVLRYCERLLLHDAVFSSVTRLRGSLWAALNRRALSLRRLLQGGNVLGTVVDDVDTIRELLPRVVLPPVTAVAVAVCAIAAVGVVLPPAVPAAAGAALLSLLLAPALALASDRTAARAETRLKSGVLRNVAAALDARSDLLANGVAAPVLAGVSAADRAATVHSQRSAWAEGLGQAVTVLACSCAALASALLAAPSVLDGSATAATVAVVVLMQLALIEPYAAAATAVRQFPALRDVLGRIAGSGVLSAGGQGSDHGGNSDGGSSESASGLVPVPGRDNARPGIQLDGVAAAWPGSVPVFTDVSATAVPGTWLAVTGPSGSGKSTLMAVLLGFLPTAAGRAAVTGTAAWCPQEAHLFDSTIRGNLLLARSPEQAADTDGLDSDQLDSAQLDRDMRSALSAVGLGPLMDRIDDGLDTRIGPGGAFLSGGERQRLAVARTLMTGADVILLDEPTAHLDADAGRRMLADLRTGLADRTVILVTHNTADIAPQDARLVLGSAELVSDDAAAGVAAAR